MDFKKQAYDFLVKKGCLNIGQKYTELEIENMLNEFAQKGLDLVGLHSFNDDETKMKISYYYRHPDSGIQSSDKKELIYEIEAECSFPQFICDFERSGTIDASQISSRYKQINPKDFGKKMFAIFFTHEDHFHYQLTPYDLERSTPQESIKENGYTDLYNNIQLHMKRWHEDAAENISEENRPAFFENLKRFQSDKSKQEFLEGPIMTMLKFEIIRPKVKLFIDEYLLKNTKYKYVRVF